MKKVFSALAAILTILLVFSCKKEEKNPEPGYMLQKWAKATERLDYLSYSKCEAYPKAEPVFKEIYKDDYFADITAVDIEKPDKKNIQKDYKGNSFIHRTVLFEGTVFKRGKSVPYQSVKGDVMFIKFLDGDRSKDGWLISNRTITRINK